MNSYTSQRTMLDRMAPLVISLLLAAMVALGAGHLIADMFAALTLPEPCVSSVETCNAIRADR